MKAIEEDVTPLDEELETEVLPPETCGLPDEDDEVWTVPEAEAPKPVKLTKTEQSKRKVLEATIKSVGKQFSRLAKTGGTPKLNGYFKGDELEHVAKGSKKVGVFVAEAFGPFGTDAAFCVGILVGQELAATARSLAHK